MTREEAIDIFEHNWTRLENHDYTENELNEALDMAIKALEQESKQGRWIEEFNDIEGEVRFTCSCCGKYQLFGTDYCYHCGARMSEVSE